MNDFVKYCQQYYENYNDYFTTKKDYQYNADKQKVKIIYFINFNLRIYFSKSTNNLKTFLIIPSIFNSYEILSINPKKTFIIEIERGHMSYLTCYRIEKFFALYSLWLNKVL